MHSPDITCYIDSLYSYAMVLARDPASASDLVQETYLRAIPATPRLREDSNVKSWLFTILRNIWYNKMRELRSRPTLVDLDAEGGEGFAVDSTGDPHGHYVAKHDVLRVRAAIQLLPPECQEIILLREYEGLSYLEIATLLSCPLGTVMSRLSRARYRLRVLLALSPGRTVATSGTAIREPPIRTAH